MKNIILTGFMGSGKTTIGKELVKLTGLDLVDTDSLIEERLKTKISDIFAKKGEPFFREYETKLIGDLIDENVKGIISTGGGMIITPGNDELLRKLGIIIYLKTSKETIVKRLQGDTTRPLLAGGLSEKTEKLLEFRAPIYERSADIVVDTDDHNPKIIAEIILERIKNYENNDN